ncbi:MAG: hypothetical protein SFV15_02255 [Polyangiaceae bacterium]|nr:hypothetical protein [Polyangiaceae bacterium]
MAEQGTEGFGFEHAVGFAPGEHNGALGLGALEVQYSELFAEALSDGVITAEERAHLERAAGNLGLDRAKLLKLEAALLAAYESHRNVRVVEQYEERASSLAPLQMGQKGGADSPALLQRISELEARVLELEAELRRAQSLVNVEVDLGGLQTAAQVASEDPQEVWRSIRRDPTNPEHLRVLYRVYDAHAEADGRWCAAQALVALNAAGPEEKACFEAGRKLSLITPTASILPESWRDFLFHPEEEIIAGQILGLIAPAVLIGRVSALGRDGRLHRPHPEHLQDPTESTLTAVRALPWAAAILGLPTPQIYVEKERDSGYEILPGVPPVTVIGRRALSGLTQPGYAFKVARHLVGYRKEHFVKSLFSAIPDLEDLFLAALCIGNPGLPIADDMKRRVAPIAQAIEPLLDAPQRDTLKSCFLHFVEEGGRTNLQRYSRSADKTACRAGLVLANDLPTVATLLESEEGKHGELFKDLVVFSTSDRYLGIRKQIGIALA